MAKFRDKAVFTTFEAAKLCHVSPLSIINWVNAGRLAAFRTPGGHRRIRKDDLVKFMRDSGIPIPDELRSGSGRLKVLVVDDEAAIRDSLAERLSAGERPYEVITAADGYEAGRLVATFRPDFVILDLRMPGIDGFQVCRSIKADPQTAGTTVIAITGFHTPETEAKIRECGAERCLSKPITPSEVAAVVDFLRERNNSGTRRRRTVRGS